MAGRRCYAGAMKLILKWLLSAAALWAVAHLYSGVKVDSFTAALVAAIYVDVPESLHPVARFSVWAHLRKLEAEGRATCPDRDDMGAVWTAGAAGPIRD